MSSPGVPAPLRVPSEDSYLELLAETLENLDLPARGQFLQRYLRATAHLDLRESQSLQLWDDMLARRREMNEQLGRPVSLKTVLMDVLSTAGLLRVPVVIEYDELKKIQINAVTDPLTGLYNRRLFSESFDKELNRARRYALPLGIVILDLHRFKEVNDKHGHPRGDDVLRAAATTLKKALRTSDSAFRIGGDEFALLLPQTDADQAVALSRRVETVFAEVLKPLQLSVSVSMDHGVANFPQDGDHADQLIRVADERLYRLKHANHGKASNGSTRTESLHATDAAAAMPPERNAVAPKPISIESKRAPEKPEPTLTAAGISVQPAPAAPRSYALQRKAERVSMAGTNAYAVLGEQGSRRARVVDLGFGGVALELDAPEQVPDNMQAVLHVPILPPVRVSLKPVWSRQTSEGTFRIGCYFVS
jgi:diguanylate cyclase (GGDEF)-like protein